MEIKDSACNRCGTWTEYRYLPQWQIRVSGYLDELYDSIDKLDKWSARARKLLKGFYAPVEGFRILAYTCNLKNDQKIEVFVPKGIVQESINKVISSYRNDYLFQLISDMEISDPCRAGSLKNAISDIARTSIGQHPRRRTKDRRAKGSDYDTGIILEVGIDKLRFPLWISPHVDLECGPQIFADGEEFETSILQSEKADDTNKEMFVRYFHVHD